VRDDDAADAADALPTPPPPPPPPPEAGNDERDPAVKALLAMAISACKRQGKYVGICGQGPSDHPDLAQWLKEQGIGSISLNPDTVIATWKQLAN
jgi:pyruvate,water dikinase